MNESAKRRFIVSYFATSILIITLWLFLSYGPVFHRNLMDLAQQDLPLSWQEYGSNVLSDFLVSAVYGICSLIPLMKISKDEKAGTGYFLGAIAVAFVSLAWNWLGIMLQHLDCSNDCAAYIPSYPVAYGALFSATFILIVVPAAYVYYFRPRKPSR